MRFSAEMPSRNEPVPTGWMAFCAAVWNLEKRNAHRADHAPSQIERNADAH